MPLGVTETTCTLDTSLPILHQRGPLIKWGEFVTVSTLGDGVSFWVAECFKKTFVGGWHLKVTVN